MIPIPNPVKENLAAHFGLPANQLVQLGGGREDSDGITYTCPTGAGEVVLKILTLPISDSDGLARMAERLRFVHFLSEAGVDIVYPLPGPDGSLLATQTDGDVLYSAYLMRKRQGHHPAGNDWGQALYCTWGRTVGKLHSAAQIYPSWTGSELIGASGLPILGWEQEWQGFYDRCADMEIKEQWCSIRARLERLPIRRDCFGFIHNDPHNQNILLDGDRIVLLDFDVANYHWFCTDISIALQGLLFGPAGGMERPVSDPGLIRIFLDSFMQGYEEENHLDPFWLDQIGLFVSYRRILLFIAMQGWLETVPEVRAGWKQQILFAADRQEI